MRIDQIEDQPSIKHKHKKEKKKEEKSKKRHRQVRTWYQMNYIAFLIWCVIYWLGWIWAAIQKAKEGSRGKRSRIWNDRRSARQT